MSNYPLLINNMPPISSFEAYKRYVNSIPNLSEEEEAYLAKKLSEENCMLSAQKLILSQLKTVLFVSNQYKGYGLPQEDLIQEGNIGLMKAVKNFNLTHKVRLYTYALIWIKSEIQSFILKNWKIVKIATTKNLKKLFFNFKGIQKELMDLGVSKQDLIKNISSKLNVSEEDARDMQQYFMNEDIFIDYESEDSEVFQLPDLRTPEEQYEKNHDQKFYEEKINESIKLLNEKQKKVLELRFFQEEKLTHKEISSILNISSERVRQIEQEALAKIKKNIII